uniref:Hemoglobin subunit alpha n=1 Tax=Taricha granulosa TaxID=8321 RepID=HBA_TARGR|nr:RecName: Full=Hemoglobin subunit alpha; AltName: Full=Alpha-globin; AltName: Full=Hemoglobin alpha chain [Taricha granulosa]prf//0402193A hemoglobin alpha [Taricha granulosa]
MKLSAEDKHNVKTTWDHIKGHEEALGAEALFRMFTSLPATRTYFPAKDLSEGSSFLHSHGKKVMGALSNAVAHIDDIDAALCKLSDKHAQDLMVDPANFPKLAHNILVVMGIHLKAHLTYPVHCSVDKFLDVVGHVLTSKYR